MVPKVSYRGAKDSKSWVPSWISEFPENLSPPRVSGSSFQFLEVSDCAFLMPIEHQS